MSKDNSIKAGQLYATDCVIFEVIDVDNSARRCLIKGVACSSMSDKGLLKPGDIHEMGIDTVFNHRLLVLFRDVLPRYAVSPEDHDLWQRTKQFVGGGL